MKWDACLYCLLWDAMAGRSIRMQRRLCSCCVCIDGRNFSYLFAAWSHFVSQLAFSSSSGLFGVPGQSTYAAGKIWMNFSGLGRDSATKIIISWPKALQATPLWMQWCHRSSGEVLGIDAEESHWDFFLFCFCAKIWEVSISSMQCPQVGVRLEWWKIWELSPVLSTTKIFAIFDTPCMWCQCLNLKSTKTWKKV